MSGSDIEGERDSGTDGGSQGADFKDWEEPRSDCESVDKLTFAPSTKPLAITRSTSTAGEDTKDEGGSDKALSGGEGVVDDDESGKGMVLGSDSDDQEEQSGFERGEETEACVPEGSTETSDERIMESL